MNSKENNLKVKTARLSIASNLLLILMKTFAGIFSGSVSIISEAIHSALDLVAAFIAFFAVKVSDKPADKEHPFGHGKYENVSGVIEAILIFVAAIWIIYEAIQKIIHEENILESNSLNLGIAVMLISGLVNWFVSSRLYKVARQTKSLALEADALHLKTDIYTSVGVGFGLLAIQLSGYYFLDPIIALCVALFIIYEAYKMLVKAFNPLLDSYVGEDELTEIKEFIKTYLPPNFNYKSLKTRKSGATTFIQFQLLAKNDCQLTEAIEARNNLSNAIINQFPNIEIIISLETVD